MEHYMPGEDFWTDMTGTGASTAAYVFTNGDTTAARGLDPYWSATPAASGGTGCVKMISAESHALALADCTTEAHFICRKSACPPGFDYYDTKYCLHVSPYLNNEPDAQVACKAIHSRARLAQSRTPLEEKKFGDVIRDSGLGRFMYLAIRKNADGTWTWRDDGSPLIVKCECI